MSSRSCIAETDQSVDNVTEGTVTVKVLIQNIRNKKYLILVLSNR